MKDEDLVTIEVVSQKFGLGIGWIRSHLNEVPHYKVHRLVRFNLEEVKEWLVTFRAGGAE